MHSTELVLRVAKERQRERLEEARHARLLREARSARYGLVDRLLMRVGDLLVSAGEKLQALSLAYSGHTE
ncbi:MAG: hypothetical protein JXA14_24860 [Anaerolineae bacterium]|nr:hypothetical protein [Anaerolineae bacterium]